MHPVLSAVGAFICASVLVGCSSVTQDYDQSYDFSKLKTYARAHEDSKEPKETQKNLVKKRILRFTRSALDAKGYRLAENRESADFLVDFNYSSREVIVPAAIQPSVAFGFGPRYYGGGYGLGLGYNYGAYQREEVESLVIDIWDAKTKEHIWTAQTERELVGKNAEKTEENFKEAITDLFENFPPSK